MELHWVALVADIRLTALVEVRQSDHFYACHHKNVPEQYRSVKDHVRFRDLDTIQCLSLEASSPFLRLIPEKCLHQ